MNRLSALLILFIFVFSACGQTVYDADNVSIFRESRDRDFRNPQMSPLRPEDLQGFDGLKYFPVDEKYCIKVTFSRTPDEKVFMMPTSAGNAAKYLKIGVLNFVLDDREFSLNAYQRQYENPNFKPADDLFVPFKDLSNGKETNDAGRYVYLKMPKGTDATIDFNLAFNPSCAYGNESFSCPIPPKDNFLPIEIKAGEKVYK